ncbi:MAG: tetratricopeptide repeat protein [Cyanobacteriota bacterium]|nr:tetratricopeptide repeat protein [Cyanobacteriota bacterium]
MTCPLLLAAATRLEPEAFHRESLLGRSLALPAHAHIQRCLRFANRAPLAHAFNHGLELAADDSLVVFCHDDLWLGDAPLSPSLLEALEHFDLVGVAGNSRRRPGQRAWWLDPATGAWDHPHLVGALRHGQPQASQPQTYGPSPAAAALLDGVFLAARASVLRGAGLRFEPLLPFHFYDLDFCRAAAAAGLRLGVWPLELIHASGGGAFTPSWKAALVLYQQKWEPTPAAGSGALIRAYGQARAHQILEQWPEALVGYDAVLALDPRHGRALQQRALVLHKLERHGEALASLDRALALDPANATALGNRASLLQVMGDAVGGEAALRQALALRPNDPALAHRLASLLLRQHRHPEAIDALRQVLRLDRHHGDALLQLGGVLMENERFDLARAAFRRLLGREPNHLAGRFGLAQCHEALGEPEAALATCESGLAVAPNDLNLLAMAASLRLGLCLWDDLEARMGHLAEVLRHTLASGAPLTVPMRLLGLPLPLELPRLVGVRHAADLAAAMAPLVLEPAPPPPPVSSGERPLRIGYLSADFRCHAMGGLIHGLFAAHDRARCVPIGYMLATCRDRYTRSVARGCERLRDVSQLGSEALARLIRDDGIDVLVDLMGYTHQGRPSALALRPAPHQLLYLGYPASTGAPFIDGIVADSWLIPPELELAYSERVWRLPHAFVCSPPLPADPGEVLPPAPSRASLGLTPEQLVFACFNRPVKLDPRRFDRWMEILRAVPGSALLLVVPEASSQRRLREHAQSRGVEPKRLVFAAKTPAAQFPHLCRLADLFLDTPHYGAGATGAMALQAGLPLLTCPGESFLSRMGASLCAAVGMEDLICPTPEAYVERAITLGREREGLRERRRHLLNPKAQLPLLDVAGWVRHWEELLWELVAQPTSGRSAQPSPPPGQPQLR